MHILAIIILLLGLVGVVIGAARVAYGKPQGRGADAATTRSGMTLLLIAALVVVLVAGFYLLGVVP